MTPYVRIEIKRTAAWPFLWLKFVTGFNPRKCCAQSLKGRYWPDIAWVKHEVGEVMEGNLDFAEPFAYLCGVNRRGYDHNLHLPMRKNPRCRWTVDLLDIRIFAEGLQRLLPIPPLSEEVAALVTPKQARCRNFRWAASTWPDVLRPQQAELF